MQVEHLILAVEPKCSGFVNRCRQSCNEMGGPDATVDILPFPFPPMTDADMLPPATTGVIVLVPAIPTPTLIPTLLGKMLFAGRSNDMSQNGSIVVDTLRQAYNLRNER